jgi:hypothetical protein
MEQIFQCVACGEENELIIDQADGEQQRLVQTCHACSVTNIIVATFNYYTSEYNLEVSSEI